MYQVAPALRPFGTDFGNGRLDECVFQFDTDFDRYRENKRESGRRRSAYVGRRELEPHVAAAAAGFVAGRLSREHPSLFERRGARLCCRLTGDMVPLDGGLDTLDALLRNVQEDLCIVSVDGDRDWISYVNVCAPSHWDPSTKLGLSFFDGHQIVPGFDRVNQGAKALVDAMVHKGPWVRFVWGLETDDRLDHHPVAPSGVDGREWNGRAFHTRPFVARYERQTLWGLPEAGAALFFIRVGFVRDRELANDPALREAVLSMSPEARRYKGLEAEFEGLIRQFAPPEPAG